MSLEQVKVAYVQVCMEYEAGWGTKPDGFVIATSREVLDKADGSMRVTNSNSYGTYLQGTITPIALNEEGVNFLESYEKGWAFIDNYSGLGKLL